jgi:alkylation response protein AidB-like acyl-CoA dehydrogenase
MWNLLLNEDERMIADSVREYLARELPLERLRPKAAPVDLARVRAEMVELGWIGVGLPEAVGGSGLGLVEELLIQRECGRYLVSPQLLATVLAAHVAAAAGDAALAGQLVGGQRAAALTILAGEGEVRPAYALDRGAGDLLLAWTEAGMGVFEPAALAEVRDDACLDDSVTLQRGTLAFGRPLHWVAADRAPLPQRAKVLLAAALTGLAEHACELAVEYAKVRQQFGKPIGTFQAVKHRCADAGVRWRLAWYQTSLAGLKLQEQARDAALQAASAKLVAATAAHENGRAAIQVHGGIGFQSECDVHWFMKRAHVYDQAGGAVAAQARLVASLPSPLE